MYEAAIHSISNNPIMSWIELFHQLCCSEMDHVDLR